MSSAVVTLAPPLAPLQADVDSYLAYKRLRLTPQSERSYRGTLRELVRFYPTLALEEFEPPKGTRLVEDFLVTRWGDRAGRTYNKNLTVLNDFFGWHVLRERLVRDPMPPIERARVSELRHASFTPEQRARILAVNPAPRDQVALRLLLDYGVRKGSLLSIRFDSFQPRTRRVEFHMKGDRYHSVPIPADDRIWQLLEQLDAPGHHYLMCRQTLRRRRPPQRKAFRDLAAALAQATTATDAIADESCRFELAWAQSALSTASDWLDLAIDTASHQVIKQFPDEPMGHHGAHDWWYRCLVRAGIVAAGVTHGARMHGARHSACTAAGTADFGTHALRHRRISLWLRHGIDAVQVSRWSGHSKPSESTDIYGHVIVDPSGDEWRAFWLDVYAARSVRGAAQVRHGDDDA